MSGSRRTDGSVFLSRPVVLLFLLLKNYFDQGYGPLQSL
jgi:hypothetical protein